MASTLYNAFLLLVVGMITVFIVLSLVVLSGNALIYLVNKFSPEPEVVKKIKKPLISNKEVAVLTAVVDHITAGKGKIELIEKLKN